VPAALTFHPLVNSGVVSPPLPVLPQAHDAAGGAALWSVPQLTAAVRRGDETAVRLLHDRYCERLTRYALVIARGDETAAAEAVQNAFLKALRSLRVLPDESALWAWLARAARTAAADAGRRSRRYAAALARFTAWFSRPEPAPEDTEAIWHDALEKALAGLDAASRALIDARYYGRESLAETAAAQKTTERAIEGRLARVRERLRRSILQQLAIRHEP
jgi:RNA polymerase sigma factor (sigma-70 family)